LFLSFLVSLEIRREPVRYPDLLNCSEQDFSKHALHLGGQTAPDTRESQVLQPTSTMQLITFADAARGMGGKVVPTESELPLPAIQGMPQKGILDRAYPLGTSTWTTSQPADTILHTLRIPQDLFAEGRIDAALQGFRYMRWKSVQITLRENIPRGLYGLLMMSCAYKTTGLGGVVYFQGCDGTGTMGTTYPHLLCAGVENDVQNFVVPWVHKKQMWKLDEETDPMAEVVLSVFNPLTSALDQPSGTATWTMHVAFEEPVAIAPTGETTLLPPLKFQIGSDLLPDGQRVVGTPLPRKNAKKHWDRRANAQMEEAAAMAAPLVTNFLSGQGEGAAKANAPDPTTVTPASLPSGGLSNMPIIGSAAKAAISLLPGKLGSAAKKVASFFGLQKPRNPTAPSGIYSTMVPDLTNSDTADNSANLTYKLGAHIDTQAQVTGGPVDEMGLGYAMQTPCCVARYQMTASTTAFTVPIHPMYDRVSVYNGTNYWTLRLSILAWICAYFNWWRGSLKHKFYLVFSPFMTGRLRIRWLPGAPYDLDPTGLDMPWDTYQVILDLQSDSSFECTTTWCMDDLWASMGYAGDGYTFGNDGTPWSIGEVSGVLIFDWQNPVVGLDNASNPPLYINHYMAAGEDFTLAMPRLPYYSSIQPEAPEDPPAYANDGTPLKRGAYQRRARSRERHEDGGSVGQISPREDFQKPFRSFHETAGQQLEMGLTMAGDRVQSIRDLIHVYQEGARGFFTFTGTSITGMIRCTVAAGCGQTPAGAFEVQDELSNTLPQAIGFTWDYFAFLYSFFRGSFNFKLVTSIPTVLLTARLVPKINYNAAVSSATFPQTWPATMSHSTYRPMIEFNQPWFGQELYTTTRNPSPRDNTLYPEVRIEAQSSSTGTSTYSTQVHVAAGDDFSFHFLHGPGLTYSSWYEP